VLQKTEVPIFFHMAQTYNVAAICPAV